jgi:hypothetical protein
VLERLLADGRSDAGALNDFALCAAALEGHAPVVARLLRDSRVNAGAQENHALRLAAGQGHAGIVKCLLADPRVSACARGGARAAVDAAIAGHTAIARLLLTHSTAIVRALLDDPRAAAKAFRRRPALLLNAVRDSAWLRRRAAVCAFELAQPPPPPPRAPPPPYWARRGGLSAPALSMSHRPADPRTLPVGRRRTEQSPSLAPTAPPPQRQPKSAARVPTRHAAVSAIT